MELHQFRIEAPISLYPASLPQKTKKNKKTLKQRKASVRNGLKYSAIISFVCDKYRSFIFVL